MGLRGVASEFARTSAGIWKGVADVIDPRPVVDPPVSGATEWSPEADQPETGPQPDGTMLVPLDTWTRVLEQIGNVHEAGQQLADARERAARAETENEFLRSQLDDLKSERRSAPATTKPPSEPAAVAIPDEAPSQAISTASNTVRRARERASRWLSP